MRLYHHPRSTCSHRVLLAAYHLGTPLDLMVVDLAKGEQRSPAFAALNPNQHVPVLEHDGFVLWESYAIMQYLAEITPGQTLYPAQPRERADTSRWMYWCAQELMPGVATLNWENAIKPLVGLGTADPAAVTRGEAQVVQAAGVLDAQLASRPWVCGDALTLADLAIAAPLADIEQAKLPMTGRTHIRRWLAQVQALDAWKRIHAE